MATSRKTTSKSGSSSKNGNKSGASRRAPGTGGTGEYYHIQLRRGDDFETFRTQDVGDPGHLQRVGGKRENGRWATVKWLVSKQDAHIEDGNLVADTQEVRDMLKKLRSKPVHKSGDLFEAKPRRNIAESAKPTAAQKKARSQNIKKAQTAKRRGR